MNDSTIENSNSTTSTVILNITNEHIPFGTLDLSQSYSGAFLHHGPILAHKPSHIDMAHGLFSDGAPITPITSVHILSV